MTPPRLAAWLLARLLPRGHEGDTICGDLYEEFAVRARRSAAAARRWYWLATLSILLRYRTPQPFSLRDVRDGVRSLLKAPAFTAIVITTLALGSGANTAIFSTLNAVVLRPLPYPDSRRLVRLVAFAPSLGISSSNVSAADLLDWERDAHAFESVAALAPFSTSLLGETSGAPAQRVGGAVVYNLFRVLGVGPSLGRGFEPGDIHPGPATAIIVSHALWQQRYGGDRARIGKPLRPGSHALLTGVMPEGFAYPDKIDLWVPSQLSAGGDPREPRDNRQYEAIARLRPGVPLEQAQAELDAISTRLEAAYPRSNKGWRVRAVPLADFVVGDAKRTLLLLFSAVCLVLFVACANVANLFVAHASSRRREIAVRAAIGAGRGRIFRQVMTEALLLSLAGSVLGLFAARWALSVLVAVGSSDIPRLENASLDSTVLLFSLAASLVTGLLFGTVPAMRLSRSNLVDALREGTHGSGTRTRTPRILVAGEVAIALVLLASAGLLARSFQHLQRTDVGFDPHNVLSARVSLAGPRALHANTIVGYYDAALEKLTALPGVQSAGAVLALPVDGGGFYLGRGFIRPGRAHPSEGYNSLYQVVTPGYFRTMRTPLVQGRDFDGHDTETSPPVAIINRTFAERFFAGENPIGQKVLVWKDEKTPREIVGVAADLKGGDLTAAAGAELFVPLTQGAFGDMTFVIRTDGPPADAIPAVKSALNSVDPTQAAYDVKTFDEIMRRALAQQRFAVVVFAAFAGLALTLAVVGLYGVMTHLVAGRRHEMGVRLALGARPSEVRRLVVRQGVLLVGIGAAIGLPSAFAAERLLGKLLYGVSAADPITFAAVTAVTAIVAAVSAWIPARRATRVDPASVLRAS